MRSLAEILDRFNRARCDRLLVKVLAENDNSKNQVYFGLDFSALNLIPNHGVTPDPENGTLKAKLTFSWLRYDGSEATAPGAQLVLYPQYPEVRFSGFLRGCRGGPNDLMARRQSDRILFLGIRGTEILGFVTRETPDLRQEIAAHASVAIGVFTDVRLPRASVATRDELLAELGRIHAKGWIRSHKLNRDGSHGPCEAPNCGGHTLEAELGINPNGYSDPDYRGWEIKQHQVTRFERFGSGAITLMTPEPTAGVYVDEGIEAFIRRFGYPDQHGRADRLNFGGIHRADAPCGLTGLTLKLKGYDREKRKIMDPYGGIALVSANDVVAAMWTYTHLIGHWQKKHALAAFIPSLARTTSHREYMYGHTVRLGEGTDILRFLSALADGTVYYDPGIKLEAATSRKPRVKRRSQFRIKSSDLAALYFAMNAYPVAA